MDRLIYTVMTGAKATMGQQAAVAHNIANVSTTGFRAEMHRLRAVQVQSPALPTRAFAADASVGASYEAGPVSQTGNPLDMAVNGKGWFVLQTPDGGEAYTRAGNFHVDENGVLRSSGGLEVMGDGGQVAIPPDNTIDIAADGTITATPANGVRTSANVVGRLKLVNPAEDQLQRGADGLFRLPGGQTADQDESVRVASGYLEGSNVSVVEQMVTMISLQRQYEMNVRMLQSAQDNDKSATQVLTVS